MFDDVIIRIERESKGGEREIYVDDLFLNFQWHINPRGVYNDKATFREEN